MLPDREMSCSDEWLVMKMQRRSSVRDVARNVVTSLLTVLRKKQGVPTIQGIIIVLSSLTMPRRWKLREIKPELFAYQNPFSFTPVLVSSEYF